VLFFNSKWIQ